MYSNARTALNKGNDSSSKFVKVNFTNHHKVLVEGLWNLFRMKRLLDFDLRLDQGIAVSAHRIVLEAFLSPDKLEQADPDSMDLMVEPEDDQHPGIKHQLDYLVELLYRGEVEVPEECLEDLVEAARELDLGQLVDAVEAARRGANCANMRSQTLRPRKGNPAKLLSARERIFERRPDRGVQRRRLPTTERTNLKEVLADAEPCATDDEMSLPSLSFAPASPKSPLVSEDPSGFGDEVHAPKTDDLSSDEGSTFLHCKHCEYQTTNDRFFELHMADHDLDPEMFSCRGCRRHFPDEYALGHHVCKQIRRMVRKSYDCSRCGQKCFSKREFDAHMLRHERNSTTKCDLCERDFPSLKKMKRHKLAKHKVFKCPHCPYEAQKAWCYYHHLFSVHQVNSKGEPVEKKQCLHCNYKCMTKTELHYHTVARHGGLRPFKCTLCDYTVGRQADLNRHVKVIHLGIKPHLCETCGFRTDTLSKLEAHSVVHTGEKKFSCDTCGQVFSNRSSLKLHIRRHESDDKPYVCHVCGNAFTRPFNLTIHLKNVHKIRVDSKSKN